MPLYYGGRDATHSPAIIGGLRHHDFISNDEGASPEYIQRVLDVVQYYHFVTESHEGQAECQKTSITKSK